MSRHSSPGLLVGFVAAAVVLAGALAASALRSAETRDGVERELQASVEALAPHTAELFALSSEQADREIRRWAAASGLRVTLIGADGVVHADSWTLPALLGRMENHINRPEVVAARTRTVGSSWRRSVTTDRPTTYVARVVGPPEAPVGFLRLAREDDPSGWPWRGVLTALLAGLAAGGVADRWSRGYHRRAVRHLAGWTDLPADADLAAIADDADRRFRAVREELARELEATRAALEHVEEGVMLLDREGVVRYANGAVAALLRSPLPQGKALVEAVRAPEVLGVVGDVLAKGGTRHTTVNVPDGPELSVRAAAVVHPVLAVAVVLTDVRGERQLERARRALVADLAHELRTPLTVLTGLAEEIADTGVGTEISSTMARQVQRLRAFAEELEELVRIESGQVTLHEEALDAAAVARQVAGDLRATAEAHGVALSVVGGPAPLTADPVRLGQVLTNLVDNAIRYNRADGAVTVRVSAGADAVRIEVEDTGLGIPAGEVPLVFQRFYRVRRGPGGVEGGSGLGLAIVKHLLRAMGGSVALESEEGKGTRVTLRFPTGSRPPDGA